MSPEALASLESGLLRAVKAMMGEIDRATVQVTRAASEREEKQGNRVLTVLQLRADALFKTLDLYHDAISTRADAEIGLLLAGTDRLLAAAMKRPVPGFTPPSAVSYLDSGGRGGAITRARTRLPGGIVLPVALVRVSPESLPTRLTSSLHEVGHQLAVDLNLLDEARDVITRSAFTVLRNPADAALWGSWTGELVPDAFAVGLGGGAPAVDGLQRVLSVPVPFAYVIAEGDPHPPGAVRVPFAVALSRVVFSDPSLDLLWQRFDALYGNPGIPVAVRSRVQRLAAAACQVAKSLARHRFRGLGGETLAAICETRTVDPTLVRQLIDEPRALRPARLALRSPLLALAMIGRARLLGHLGAAAHDRVSRAWLAELARTGASTSAAASVAYLVRPARADGRAHYQTERIPA